jgi:hypothetical protein
MHEAGIFVLINEVSSETAAREGTDNYGKTKITSWLSIDYDISLFHESGVVFGPVRRSIQVIASGPQAYASGVSFVEKYFLRSLFKIPTGEKDDVDALAPQELPPSQRLAPSPPKPAEPKSDYLDQEGSQIARDVMIEAVAMAESEDDLRRWYADNSAQITRLLEADKASVRDAYGDRLQSLKGKVAA